MSDWADEEYAGTVLAGDIDTEEAAAAATGKPSTDLLIDLRAGWSCLA